MDNYFRSNLTALRKAKKLTQPSIANQLGKSGATNGGWENGVSEPSLEALIQLAEILSISIELLLTEELREGNLSEFIRDGEKTETSNLIDNPKGNLNRVYTAQKQGMIQVNETVFSKILETLQNIEGILRTKEI